MFSLQQKLKVLEDYEQNARSKAELCEIHLLAESWKYHADVLKEIREELEEKYDKKAAS